MYDININDMTRSHLISTSKLDTQQHLLVSVSEIGLKSYEMTRSECEAREL